VAQATEVHCVLVDDLLIMKLLSPLYCVLPASFYVQLQFFMKACPVLVRIIIPRPLPKYSMTYLCYDFNSIYFSFGWYLALESTMFMKIMFDRDTSFS